MKYSNITNSDIMNPSALMGFIHGGMDGECLFK